MDANDKKTAAVSASVTTSVGTPDAARNRSTEPKKKKGSTKASRRGKDVEKRVSKAMTRFAKAADKGVNKYNEKRDKSDRKKRDGALLDLPENAARGLSKAAADASPAIGDFVKLFSTKKSRKSVRRNLRNIPAIPFM